MTDEKLPDVSRNRMSRRTVLKLTGAGAAIAWTTPIISSVRMPAFAASQNCSPLWSDDFEGESCGVPPAGGPDVGLGKSVLANWGVSGPGNVDIIGPPCGVNYLDLGSVASKVVDLDGTPCGPSTITTNVSYGPGNFQLDFDLYGSLRSQGGSLSKSVTVTFGSFSETFTLPAAAGITHFSRSVSLAGSSPLSFAQSGSDCIGLLLDNVAISECPV